MNKQELSTIRSQILLALFFVTLVYIQDFRNLASWSDQLSPGGWLRNLIQSLESRKNNPKVPSVFLAELRCILSRDRFMLRVEAEIFYEQMPDTLTS